MDSIRKFGRIIAVFCLLILAGCGGGGGGGDGGGNQPTTAKVVLSTVLQDGYSDQIGSINVTGELPDGVTVPSDSNGWIPLTALFLSGQGAAFAAITPTAIITGKFYPATVSSKAKVSIAFSGIANSNGLGTGMNPGEFATLICVVAPGTNFDAATSVPLSGIDIANFMAVIPHLSDTTPPLARITYQINP